MSTKKQKKEVFLSIRIICRRFLGDFIHYDEQKGNCIHFCVSIKKPALPGGLLGVGCYFVILC